jgi:hypothetical protein
MKVVPKKDQPDVAGGYIAPDYPDSPCTPYPWPPIQPDPIVPEQPAAPCESPLP